MINDGIDLEFVHHASRRRLSCKTTIILTDESKIGIDVPPRRLHGLQCFGMFSSPRGNIFLRSNSIFSVIYILVCFLRSRVKYLEHALLLLGHSHFILHTPTVVTKAEQICVLLIALR